MLEQDLNMGIILIPIASITQTDRDETLVVPTSSPCFFPAFPSSILADRIHSD